MKGTSNETEHAEQHSLSLAKTHNQTYYFLDKTNKAFITLSIFGNCYFLFP